MKRILLLICVLSAGTLMHAQAVFQYAMSIPFYSTPSPKTVVQTSDGGYLIGANNATTGGSILVKTDANGLVTWTKSIAGSSSSNTLIQAGECIGGGYYAFGDGTDSLFTSSGFSLTKLDPAGNVIWAKLYPNSLPGYGYSKVRQTSDGGFLVSESFYSSMGALKLDVNGNVTWSHAFSDDPNDNSPKCPSFDCAINNDGSMVFTGKRNSDVCMVKADANGNMAWSSVIGNGSSYYHTYGVSATADGGYVVCGYADFSPFIMKVTSTGAMVWYHVMNNNQGGEFDQIKELPNGNLIVVGVDGYYTNTIVAILDQNGSILSSSSFGNGTNESMSSPTMCLTADGGFAIAGTFTNSITGMSALTLMKTDANGNFPCTFNYYPMTFNTGAIVPTVLGVTIYTFNHTTTANPQTSNSISLNTTQTDFCTLFGTNDQSALTANIAAFPSPIASGENLQLNVSGIEGNSVINVYDASGKVVRQINKEFSLSTTSSLEISTADLSSGIYLVRITGADQKVLGVTKFIVR